jgi:hypothetical protein
MQCLSWPRTASALLEAFHGQDRQELVKVVVGRDPEVLEELVLTQVLNRVSFICLKVLRISLKRFFLKNLS